MTTVLETALSLGARGVPCFPCNAKKEPTCPQGFKAASIDAGTLRNLWANHPGSLIGVPTGVKFVVVDFDFAKHPEAKTFHDKNELPVTRIHRTGSGGVHYLFQPNAAVRCTTSKIHKGIDTRGLGGYVIWWPAQGLERFNPAALAEVPDVFIAVLRPKPTISERARVRRPDVGSRQIEGPIRALLNARQGERNHLAFWTACRLAEQGLSRGDVLSLVTEAGQRVGLTSRELTATVNSALRTVSIK
jgi:hypothetical protein